MAKRVILAVAGSGKTYYICHSIDPLKRNLILAFTHENVFNIKRELIDAFGNVPDLTAVTTFDSFVYHNFILPYEPSIGAHFGNPTFVSRGITMVDPPPRQIKAPNGNPVPNVRYSAKNKLSHYVSSREKYYCSTLSELALQVKKGRESLVKRGAARLDLFYDSILIDEFQDFRAYDYDLIIKIAKSLPDVTLVGDFYQHSVSGTNNSGKPFLVSKRGEVTYSEFVEKIKNEGFEVDETSLKESRRCSGKVCKFVRQKINIPIFSTHDNEGEIIWAENEIDSLLLDDRILKLLYKDSDTYTFLAMNWSYSKGNTIDSACVILTNKFEQLGRDDFSLTGISQSTLNKLYVALTRSKGNVFLIKASDFKEVKARYIKR